MNGIANCAWPVSAVAGPVGAVDRRVGVVTWWTLPLDICVTPPNGPHFCDENDVVGVGPNFGPPTKETNPPPVNKQFDPSKPRQNNGRLNCRVSWNYGLISRWLKSFDSNRCAITAYAWFDLDIF
jgi:hypothetical protein